MIGIVGHSQVGKSTLINLVMRLYDATSGQVLIDGTDVRDISQNSLRSEVEVVAKRIFSAVQCLTISAMQGDASFEEIVNAAKTANCYNLSVPPDAAIIPLWESEATNLQSGGDGAIMCKAMLGPERYLCTSRTWRREDRKSRYRTLSTD